MLYQKTAPAAQVKPAIHNVEKSVLATDSINLHESCDGRIYEIYGTCLPGWVAGPSLQLGPACNESCNQLFRQLPSTECLPRNQNLRQILRSPEEFRA